MVGLPAGEKVSSIFITVLTEYWRVRRTDIVPWHTPRYAYASRGKSVSTSAILSCFLLSYSPYPSCIPNLKLLASMVKHRLKASLQVSW